MHLALFGASGRTGQLLTERALAEGHTISALVRNPASYPLAAKVKVIAGNPFSPADIARTLDGADAVLSALGARSWKREDVIERALPLIIAGMGTAGVSRIVVLGSAGAVDSAMAKQPAWRRWLVENIVYKTALKWPVESQRAQYALLAASPLDWTMVMPPMLTNGAAQGNLRVDGEALPRNASNISRADVADFMVKQLFLKTWSRKGVYITS
jgi:putative NADH-flavin reductase